MSGPGHPGEYDGEPVRGLPERLPEGERLLWQGSPCWRSLARRAFHTHKVMAYFGLLLAWSLVSSSFEGHGVAVTAGRAMWVVVPFVSGTGLLLLLAWLNARATVYTITTHRLVIRFGVALQLAVNLPFRTIVSADLRRFKEGTGDIPLRVNGAEQCGYMMLWPHARAWHFGSEAQPTLRCIPEVDSVAEILKRALAASQHRPLAESEVQDDVARSEKIRGLATAAS